MAISHELASPFLQGDGRGAVGAAMVATGGTPVAPVNGRGLAKTLQNAKFPLSAAKAPRQRIGCRGGFASESGTLGRNPRGIVVLERDLAFMAR